MSRYLDLSNNHVLFVGESPRVLDKSLLLPVEAFTTSGNTEEMALVSQIFECAKSIAQLKLSEYALSLYSASILLTDGRISINVLPKFSSHNWWETPHWNILIPDLPGLRNLDEIRKLNESVTLSLGKEILRSQAGSIEAFNILIKHRDWLRLVQTNSNKTLLEKGQKE